MAVPRQMVVTADPDLGYLVHAYTPVRSWAGHAIHTPHYERRMLEIQQAFQAGVILPAWTTMHVFYIQRSSEDSGWKSPAGSSEAFRNNSYAVWEVHATPETVSACQL